MSSPGRKGGGGCERGAVPAWCTPLGYPDDHMRIDFIGKHFDNKGAEYAGNFMMKYKDVSFIVFTVRLRVA